MATVPAYAARDAGTPLAPFSIERCEPGPDDVQIETLYCGVCHTDIHLARDEWGGSGCPVVPGHEIVGRGAAAGGAASTFAECGRLGVDRVVDSCRRACPSPRGPRARRRRALRLAIDMGSLRVA